MPMKFLDKLLGASDSAGTLALSKLATAVHSAFTPQTTAEVIEEIHHAFNTAGDKLLVEAKAMIANTDSSSFEKADSLRAIGFGNAKGVQEASATQQELHKKKQLQQFLVDYSVKYPTYRFIDDAGIEAICNKYSLVFGNASQYTGFVPSKNLAEIKAFKGVEEEDFVWQMRTTYRGDEPGKWQSFTNPRSIQDYMSYGSIYQRYETRDSKTYLICAPLKEMKLEANQEVKGFQIVQVHIPDPVVLLPVRGDLYIILTAWGDEASDPLVVKEGLN